MLWVLVTAEFQYQANAQHWPGGPLTVQHPNVLALLDALAAACPLEARSDISQVINGCSAKGVFGVG